MVMVDIYANYIDAKPTNNRTDDDMIREPSVG